MVFTYIDATTRTGYGTFAEHKKLLDSESWFPPMKAYVELLRCHVLAVVNIVTVPSTPRVQLVRPRLILHRPRR
jgi:hypothetical protein